MTSSEVIGRWNEIRDTVTAQAALYEQNPADAAARGVEPEIERANDSREIFDGPRRSAPVNLKAAWLRTVARKTVPPEFKWTVVETVGGGAFLTLLSYEPGPSRDDPLTGLNLGAHSSSS